MLKFRLLENFSQPLLKELIYKIASETKWIPTSIDCDFLIIIRHNKSDNAVLEFGDIILRVFIGLGAWEFVTQVM